MATERPPPPRKLPAFVKQMLPGEGGVLPRRGEHIAPRYARDKLAHPPSPVVKLREEMFERVRLKYAPHMPSRLDSVFATDKKSLEKWRWELRLSAAGRVPVRVRAADPNRAVEVDAAHFDRVHDLIEEALDIEGDSPKAVRQRRALMRKAEAAAKDYWTKPPQEGTLHEWLLGGGATYIGRVNAKAPQDEGGHAAGATPAARPTDVQKPAR